MATPQKRTATGAKAMDVVLTGHSLKSSNLGVGALAVGDLQILREEAAKRGIELRIHFIDVGGPQDYRARVGALASFIVNSWKGILVPTSEIWRTMRKADFVVDITGGDSFADIYGWGRFRFAIAPKIVALLARAPLVLAPQTIGPFQSPVARWVARRIMRRARFVFARDHQSMAYAREQRFSRRLKETVDVAVVMAPAAEIDYPPAPPGTTTIGLNVSGLLWNLAEQQGNVRLTVDYQRLIRKVIDGIGAMEGVRLVLVPHVMKGPGTSDEDVSVCETLAREYGLPPPPVLRSPPEAKAFIAKTDAFVGARMHATIAALSSGVPVLAHAYSRKFSGLFGSLNYDGLVDCQTETTEEAIRRTLAFVHDAEAYRRPAEQAAALARRKLDTYRAAIGELMGDRP